MHGCPRKVLVVVAVVVVVIVVVVKVVVVGVLVDGVVIVVVVVDVVGVVVVIVVVAGAVFEHVRHVAGIHILSIPLPTHRPCVCLLGFVHVCVVADTVVSWPWISCTHLVIAAASPTCAAICRHDFLSFASASMSCSVRCGDRSMKNPPVARLLNCTLTANFTSLSPLR